MCKCEGRKVITLEVGLHERCVVILKNSTTPVFMI